MAAVSGSGRGDETHPRVRVDVLGPLRVTVGEQAVDVPGPKRRALLALLVMAGGQAVPVDDLLDALWPGELPQSARATLQSHISRLRRHLGAAACRLEGLTGAYRLGLDDAGHGSDVARAGSLLAAAGTATPGDARALLDEARALWRGPPLAEFADVGPLAAWSVALAELRRAVDEAHVVATLEGVAPGDAVELATALVTADPLAEAGVLLLMRALSAAGRSVEALRAAYDYRRLLATESGLEPSGALGALERQIAGAANSPPGRPPRASTRLHGRDSELAALHRLLEEERLVTVLGPGGVGKSRLALEIAARADNTTALMLAPVTGAEAIPHALASALGLHVVQGDVLAACAALLSGGPHLLLVDNCEHVLAGAREVVASLLDACPALTVLATSREPLGLPAEQRLRVAPLPTVQPRSLGDVGRSPAVAVFLDRARRVRPGFSPDADELALIGDIVRRLDGMPLAIELAAGRLSSLDVGDLHARLDGALDLLSDGHLALRRTLGWSYDLLPAEEQRLFRRLGVFPDGFDLATVETVGAALAVPHGAAGALAHLVDASMVEVAFSGQPRYRMLDTMRSFACDQLEVWGETEAATEQFVRWALDLVAWIDGAHAAGDAADADRRLRRELANLRAAWRICRDGNRLDDAVAIVLGLADTAGWRDLTEVWGWILELAEDAALENHDHAGLVLGNAAGCAWSRGELDRADRLVETGLRLGGGDWSCLASAAMVALSRGELRLAVDLGKRAADLAERADQSLGVAALAAAYDGDREQAAALAARLAGSATSPTIASFSHYVAGEIEVIAGRSARAEEHYEQAIALSQATGATFVEGLASVGLLTLRTNQGSFDDALRGYRELVDYWDRTGGWIQQWTTLRNLARLLRLLHDEETALFLEGAARAAPDAPPEEPRGDEPRSSGDVGEPAATLTSRAVTSRARVLAVARQAIDRQRALVRRGG